MQIDALVKSQRTYFQSGATRPLSFRLDSLRKLQKALKDNEGFINEALQADLHKIAF